MRAVMRENMRNEHQRPQTALSHDGDFETETNKSGFSGV